MEIDLTGAVSYHHGAFPPTGFDYQRLLPAVVEASTALARFDQMVKTLHNESLFLTPLRNQEAILSSRIEGTISTLDEILEYEAESEPGDEEGELARAQKVRPDIVETILYRRALVSAQEAMAEGRPMSGSLIKSMHQQLLSFGRGSTKSPGQFKHEQNYIGERSRRKISFVPVEPEKLDEGLTALFEYASKSEEQTLIRIAATHLEFEALHPFKDGNGRVGRMLITLLLWQTGAITSPHFYISQYFEERKEEYIDRMREVSETRDWNNWCLFFLDAVKTQANRNLETMEQIRNLYEEMKEDFHEILSSKYTGLLLDVIFERPVFRIKSIVEATKIPAQTINRFCKTLVENEILVITQQAAGSRAAIYGFEPLLKIVRV